MNINQTFDRLINVTKTGVLQDYRETFINGQSCYLPLRMQMELERKLFSTSIFLNNNNNFSQLLKLQLKHLIVLPESKRKKFMPFPEAAQG